jgi:hypothetical protein
LNPSLDIEALRQTLAAAEARLRTVADVGGPHMGTLEFALDGQDRLCFANADATAHALLPVAQPAFHGKPVLEVFTGMAGTDLPAALEATARDGTPLTQRSYAPPGLRLSRSFALFGFQSAPGHAVVKFWESTGWQDRQAIALRNEEFLTHAFGQSPVAIAIVRERDATLLDVNAEWTRLTGYRREQALGRTAVELGFWPDAEARARALSTLNEGGAAHDLPLVFVTPDGRRVDFSVHAAKVSLGGEPHLLIYLLDMTARLAAEAGLRGLNAELESRVAERTAELAHARDEAERANRSKSEFLSGMSHELRTPMNAVLGFAQLLAAETTPALSTRQHGHVRQILRAGSHLLELINEVLDLARIEAGKLQISLEPVDLAALIGDGLSLMLPVAREYGVELVPTAPPECGCHVWADRTRVRQVLLNLLSNAIKYNREQGRVWVGCTVDADQVRIGVTDTGPGLSAEQQRRLFRDFERLDADQAPIEGSGIGLALSRRLVTMMDGEIGVDSQLGQGSTFWLRLRRAEPTAAPAPAADALAGAAASATGRRRKVLYVEDNPVNVLLMEAVMARRPQVQLISAPLPGLGLDLARTECPDLILLDIQLPGMDGFELLRRLRQAAATQQVPVIAISANAMASDVSRGLAAGFVRYLTKPIDLPQVLRAVDELLGD